MHSRLADGGVAVIPFGLGLVGPGAHGMALSVPLSAGICASLYWRRRAPGATLAACFAFGAVQLVIAAVAGGTRAPVLPGLYDLGIVIAIYSAVAYGTRPLRIAAVAGGIGGAGLAALVWVRDVPDAWNKAFALFVLFTPVLLA